MNKLNKETVSLSLFSSYLPNLLIRSSRIRFLWIVRWPFLKFKLSYCEQSGRTLKLFIFPVYKRWRNFIKRKRLHGVNRSILPKIIFFMNNVSLKRKKGILAEIYYKYLLFAWHVRRKKCHKIRLQKISDPFNKQPVCHFLLLSHFEVICDVH